MDEGFSRVWIRAIDEYLKTISKDDLAKICSINDQASLLDQSKLLQKAYNSGAVARSIDRVSPFLAKLQSFSEVVNKFTSAKPEIAALVWGSVSFVLEVCDLIGNGRGRES